MSQFLLPIIIILVCIAVLYLLLEISKISRKKEGTGRNTHLRRKDTKGTIREANRRLAQNPRDTEALSALADIYYREEMWEKSMKTYELLMDLCATHTELKEFEVTMRYALSAVRLKNQEEAYKGLLLARSMRHDIFEINFNLGSLEYQKQNYDKAVVLLKQALEQQPEHREARRFLGHSLFKARKWRDALVLLKKIVEQELDDKESLFAMAECYYELGHHEQAIKLFSHLRPDPQFGPSAALYAGTIHLNLRQYPRAIMDFEIGLRHTDIRLEVMLEIKYRLAAAYTKQQDIGKTLTILNEIRSVAPNYKNVGEQITRYQELTSNRNLQIFLISPTSDFISLCRKICGSFFPHSKVKIIDISFRKNEYADILTHVETRKWEDMVVFRFIRTTGQVGELLLRDFHSRIKDLKAGRGFCLCAGVYTDGAKAFVEARLIDLIEKDRLMKLLNELDARSPVSLT